MKTCGQVLRTAAPLAALIVTAGCIGAQAPEAPVEEAGPRIRTRIVDMGPLRLDGISHSMEGAWGRVALPVEDMEWITGFRTRVHDAATDEPMGEEFFCHSQIQLATGARLMVAATGISDVRLPEGFAVPVRQIVEDLEQPWRQVSLLGMALNNHEPELSRDVTLRFAVDYVDERDAAVADLQKLYRASVTVLPEAGVEVWQGDPPRRVDLPEHAHGQVGHWMVAPGRQVVRQVHTGLVPGPTRVHYGVAHMHNHGVSLKLTDVTEGEVLWETRVQSEAGRAQIARIPVYSSTEGFVMHPDHEYEIESVYDNATGAPVDAMAVMYLYHHPLGDQDLTYPPAPGARPLGTTSMETAGD